MEICRDLWKANRGSFCSTLLTADQFFLTLLHLSPMWIIIKLKFNRHICVNFYHLQCHKKHFSVMVRITAMAYNPFNFLEKFIWLNSSNYRRIFYKLE